MKGKKSSLSRYVFCDFDGTITSQETLDGVFKRFVPELYPLVRDKMMALELTIRQGVRQLLESIPSKHYPEILEYAQEVPIRPGFVELLDFLDEKGVPFVVVSGGIRGMVDVRLGDLAKRMHKIFALDLDTSDEFLKVHSDFEGDTELMAKVDVMNLFDAGQRIVIGDGATDINMARQGSIVFARDSLAFFLGHMNIPYKEWSDFFDVRKELEALWGKEG